MDLWKFPFLFFKLKKEPHWKIRSFYRLPTRIFLGNRMPWWRKVGGGELIRVGNTTHVDIYIYTITLRRCWSVDHGPHLLWIWQPKTTGYAGPTPAAFFRESPNDSFVSSAYRRTRHLFAVVTFCTVFGLDRTAVDVKRIKKLKKIWSESFHSYPNYSLPPLKIDDGRLLHAPRFWPLWRDKSVP